MKSIRLLAVLVIVIAITASFQKNFLRNIKNKEENTEKKILSTPILTPVTKSTGFPTPSSFSKRQISISRAISKSINSFVYPGSEVKIIEINKVEMQSKSDPQVITDWYKEKIRGLGMRVNSFIQTNANGNVLNRLVSQNAEFKIDINITRKSNEENTRIEVSFK